MHIELWPAERIKPYESNPRKNDAAIDAVARSIETFGFRQPVVVDGEGVIVVGHTRWKAAQKLGLAEVPVHVASELTPEQARAYRIADNQSATIATWDSDLLPLELTALKDMGFNLDLLGFGDDLAQWLAPKGNPGLVDEDQVPEPPDEATTRVGDLWILGEHRLLCGDSARAEDVDRLVDGAVIHLACEDPPYGVRVEPRSNNAIAAGLSSFTRAAGGQSPADDPDLHDQQSADLNRYPGKGRATHKKLRAKDRPLANDFVSDEEFARLLAAWFGNTARVLMPGGPCYIWGGYGNLGNYPPALQAAGLYFSQAIIWDKQHPVLTRKDFMGAHEICFYGWREGAGHHFYGPKNVPDIWQVKKVTPTAMVHLTEKPVELARRAIEYSSKAGENVLDLFGGSGSSLIAAEQTGRRAYLMELDPLYADVIVARWEQFAGKKAERTSAAA